MAYATGKYAIAQCDRCSFEYPLNQLKKEWNGLKTCPECWEPKHPQLEPLPHVMDPEALYEPRPNTDKEKDNSKSSGAVKNLEPAVIDPCTFLLK